MKFNFKRAGIGALAAGAITGITYAVGVIWSKASERREKEEERHQAELDWIEEQEKEFQASVDFLKEAMKHDAAVQVLMEKEILDRYGKEAGEEVLERIEREAHLLL